MLTGHTDVDRVVMRRLNLEDVQTLCSIYNQSIQQLCRDDVIKQRLLNAKVKVDNMINAIMSCEFFEVLQKPYQDGYYYLQLYKKLGIKHDHDALKNSMVEQISIIFNSYHS